MTNYFLEQYFGREQAHKMAYFSKIQHFSIRKGHFRIFLGHLLIIFFYKKEEKLMIFQKNINPAMSDYCRSHTECYKVVEERKVLCTLIMQTTSWLISTIWSKQYYMTLPQRISVFNPCFLIRSYYLWTAAH